MSERILDLTKIVRARRSACAHKNSKVKRNGIARCNDCGDEFPCRSTCNHLDCAEQRVNLGIGDWPAPETYPLTVTMIDSDGVTILFDVPPLEDDEDDFDIESVL